MREKVKNNTTKKNPVKTPKIVFFIFSPFKNKNKEGNRTKGKYSAKWLCPYFIKTRFKEPVGLTVKGKRYHKDNKERPNPAIKIAPKTNFRSFLEVIITLDRWKIIKKDNSRAKAGKDNDKLLEKNKETKDKIKNRKESQNKLSVLIFVFDWAIANKSKGKGRENKINLAVGLVPPFKKGKISKTKVNKIKGELRKISFLILLIILIHLSKNLTKDLISK